MTRWKAASKPLAGALAALGLLLAAPAGADQTDPRLDALFETLQSGELSYAEAKGLEQRIWSIWVDAESGSGDVMMKDGVQAMNDRAMDRAIDTFTALIDLDPDFAEAWNKRATVRYLIGDYAGSIEDIKRTLSLEPRHFGAMAGLGLCYDRLEEHDAARTAYRKALELNPYQASIEQRLEMLDKQAEENKI